MCDISDLERIIHFGTQSEGLILSSFSFSSGLEGNETRWWTPKFAVCQNLIVGHRMKLSEGNWQKEIDTTINLIPEAKPHLSRYLSSERLKFQRDKFVTKAWWSFKDGWDFTLNLFSRPPLLVFLSAENITSKVGKQLKWTKSKTKVTQWNHTQCTLMENKQVHTSITFIVEFSELFTKSLHWYRT